jgi:hypothetical protein
VQFRSLVVELAVSGAIRRHPRGAPPQGDVMRGKYEFPGMKQIHGIEIERPVISPPGHPRRSKADPGAQSIQ